MVQESGNISLNVARIELVLDAPGGLPAASIVLNDLSLSCHVDIDEEDLDHLVSRMEVYLRESVLEAYHQSSERISD